jgi:hypothetical protein
LSGRRARRARSSVSVYAAPTRDRDRIRPSDDLKLSSLIDGVTAKDLVKEISALAEDGMASKEVVNRVAALNGRLHLVQDAIKLRFIYYSRLTTVGSIAQLLVHEIRNRTTSIGRFLRTCRRPLDAQVESAFASQLELAESSVSALERLADTFAPLPFVVSGVANEVHRVREV